MIIQSNRQKDNSIINTNKGIIYTLHTLACKRFIDKNCETNAMEQTHTRYNREGIRCEMCKDSLRPFKGGHALL